MDEKNTTPNIFSEKLFIAILLITLIIVILVLFLMFYNLNFIWKPADLKSYTNFIDTFNLPLGLLTAGLAVLSFYALIYRLRLTEKQILQTQEQIKLSQKTTTLSQYLEHRKYIKERLKELEDLREYGISIPNKNAIYKKLFPENSPKVFEIPTESNAIKYPAHKLIGNFCNDFKLALVTIDTLNNIDDENFITEKFETIFTNLLLDLGQLGITFKSDYYIKSMPVSANGEYASTVSAIKYIIKEFAELIFYEYIDPLDNQYPPGEKYFNNARKMTES